jgi:5-methylcytosine-specific restriction endonuclease McrA
MTDYKRSRTSGGVSSRATGSHRTSQRLRSSNPGISDNSRGTYLKYLKAARLEANGGICDNCKRSVGRDRYSGTIYADHILPVSLGGVTSKGNIQILCGRCHEIKIGSANRKGRNLLKANSKISNAKRRKTHESTTSKRGESWKDYE